MSNLITNPVIDTLMQATTQAGAQTALGVVNFNPATLGRILPLNLNTDYAVGFRDNDDGTYSQGAISLDDLYQLMAGYGGIVPGYTSTYVSTPLNLNPTDSKFFINLVGTDVITAYLPTLIGGSNQFWIIRNANLAAALNLSVKSDNSDGIVLDQSTTYAYGTHYTIPAGGHVVLFNSDTTYYVISASVTLTSLGAVAFNPQVLTTKQQSQARVNVGLPAPLLVAPSVRGLAKPFNSEKSSYNVNSSSIYRFLAALGPAASGIGLLEVVVLGSSISAGTGAATKLGSWPSQLHDILVKMGYPDGGSGFIAATSNNAGTPDNRVTLGTGWSAFNPFYTNLAQGISTAGSITFADTQSSTSVTVWYVDFFTYGARWTIDGVVQTDIPCNNTFQLRSVTVTGLGPAIHTVVITPKTGTNSGHPIYIMGVSFKNTTGVCVHNLAIGGMNTTNTLPATSYSPITMAKALSPKLTLVEAGVNEGVPLSSLFATNMGSIITAMQGVGSDVVMIGESPTGYPAGYANAASVPVVYGLADTDNLAVVDMSDRFISWSALYALGLGFNDGDTVHLTDTGYAVYAKTLAESLF